VDDRRFEEDATMSDSGHAAAPHRGPERRRAPRVDAQGRLVICVLTERRLEARLYDFSAGGFSVRCPQPLSPGTVHQVLIASRQTPAEALTARVAYCARREEDDGPPRYQVGFTFVDVDETSRRRVDTLLEELTAFVGSLTA
jgi:c-di-GMP-binding flagellar brake protein YcgR